MDLPSDFVKLLDLIHKICTSEINKFDYEDTDNDNIFSSEKLTKTVALFVTNFVNNRQNDPVYNKPINDLKRLLSPHCFDGEMFNDAFGVKDVMEDISLYRNERWLFLHYELTEIVPPKQDEDPSSYVESWKLEGTFSNINVAFRTKRDIVPEKHHITKVYFRPLPDESHEEGGGDKQQRAKSEYFGRRIFPSAS